MWTHLHLLYNPFSTKEHQIYLIWIQRKALLSQSNSTSTWVGCYIIIGRYIKVAPCSSTEYPLHRNFLGTSWQDRRLIFGMHPYMNLARWNMKKKIGVTSPPPPPNSQIPKSNFTFTMQLSKICNTSYIFYNQYVSSN